MTGASDDSLHPVVRAAGEARGRLPAWARATPARREHMERVAALMEEWATGLGLPERERIRWRAAARLHDALKDADPPSLRPLVAGEAWPEWVLHGPACAAKLRAEGVDDESLLVAVAHHSTGHPDLDDLGRFLYLADYLEPGRAYDEDGRGGGPPPPGPPPATACPRSAAPGCARWRPAGSGASLSGACRSSLPR